MWMLIPMYLVDALTPDTFEATLMALQVLKAVIGVGIAIIAYQGYRKNDSRPMLFLATGFILVLGLPFLLYLVGFAVLFLLDLPSPAQAGVIILAELSQIAGLISILYALRM